MTDISSSCTYKYTIDGDIKLISIVTPSTAATSDTIDLNSDTMSKSVHPKIATILNTLFQDDAGADKTCTWAPSTGIITLGTISTGIHNLLVWGI